VRPSEGTFPTAEVRDERIDVGDQVADSAHASRKGGDGSRVTHPRGIILKSPREIEKMRVAGRLVHRVLTRLREVACVGVTTGELNRIAEEMIRAVGAIPLFKGVVNRQARFPFPAALCTSVNEQIVHGIPNERPLSNGDIVSVDCGVRLGGYCGDSATTIAIGSVSAEDARLMSVTQDALNLAVREIRPGRRWSEIARRIQTYVEDHGFSVVRDFVGHGIGRDMHEEPKVPNYWDGKNRRMDFELVPHMVLAVEPMVNAGKHQVDFEDEDRWAVVTRDRKKAAHFEHTIAVTETGADVLTDGR